jgi:ATP-binding cassette subfamily B (MDR/TAP) protein 1
LLVGIAAAIGAGVPFPLLGILFGQLVDSLNSATCSDDSMTTTGTGDPQAEVNAKVLLVVYLTIAYFVLIYIYIVCFSLFGERLSHRLRTTYFSSLLRQEVGFFDTELPPGEVASRLAGDIALIKAGTSEKVGVWIYSMSFFVTAYIVAFIKEARLAGMLISLVPAFMIMSLLGGFYIEKFASKVSDHIASAAAIALEGLSHVMVVQAFRANSRLESRFAAELRQARKQGIKKAVATAMQSGMLYFIAYGASGLAFWQGSRDIASAADGASDMSVGATYTVIFILVDGKSLSRRETLISL